MLIEFLLQNGANIDSTTTDGLTALHITAQGESLDYEFLPERDSFIKSFMAIKGKEEETINLLIKLWCNPNAIDNNGNTLAHYGAKNSLPNVIETCLNINPKNAHVLNREGNTVLHIALLFKNLETAEYIIKSLKQVIKFNISNISVANYLNQKNNDGETALHIATSIGSFALVNVLLIKKADPNILNQKKMAPLDYAFKYNYTHIAQLLLQNNAIFEITLSSSHLAFEDIKTLYKL